MEKKKTNNHPKPLQVIRSGEVAVSVHRRQSNAGYCYLCFELSRIWASANSGKESQASTFFSNHEEDLIEAIRKAGAWLRQQESPPTGSDAVPATTA